MLCSGLADETNGPIKRIIMQNGRSPSSGSLGTVEKDAGEVEEESHTGEGTLEPDKRESCVDQGRGRFEERASMHKGAEA